MQHVFNNFLFFEVLNIITICMHQIGLRICHLYSDNKVLYIAFFCSLVCHDSNSPGQGLHAACPVLYVCISMSHIVCWFIVCSVRHFKGSVHGLFTLHYSIYELARNVVSTVCW